MTDILKEALLDQICNISGGSKVNNNMNVACEAQTFDKFIVLPVPGAEHRATGYRYRIQLL